MRPRRKVSELSRYDKRVAEACSRRLGGSPLGQWPLGWALEANKSCNPRSVGLYRKDIAPFGSPNVVPRRVPWFRKRVGTVGGRIREVEVAIVDKVGSRRRSKSKRVFNRGKTNG